MPPIHPIRHSILDQMSSIFTVANASSPATHCWEAPAKKEAHGAGSATNWSVAVFLTLFCWCHSPMEPARSKTGPLEAVITRFWLEPSKRSDEPDLSYRHSSGIRANQMLELNNQGFTLISLNRWFAG